MAREGVQLIAYADRFGGSLPGLLELLEGPLAGVFAGVHVLPFYDPIDGADAGFDPVDHTRIDARLGTWQDLAAIAVRHEVMADVIVNHVSAASAQFRDVIARGEGSPFFELFLTMSDVYPHGADEAELAGIYRPRPGLPFTPVTLGGRKRLLWTTFTPQQIDINVDSAAGQAYLETVLTTLAHHGVRLARLDAVGYAVKRAGTSSFMTADTYAFIDQLTARAHELGIRVLVEIHAHFERQRAIASRVDLVYDFALPPLLLHALYAADAEPLLHWLRIRPDNAVTVLDTHDGIGVIDVGADQIGDPAPGLLTPEQVHDLVEGIHEHSEGQSRAASGWAASNLDVYQVNCTYFDAVGKSDDAYLLARAVQFFTPGIPQLYYVGLLAGGNDMALLARTGVGRDINRHHYRPDEILTELDRPVVRALLALIRFRNTQPAFAGTCTVAGGGSVVTLTWEHGADRASLEADVATRATRISATKAGTTVVCERLLDADVLASA